LKQDLNALRSYRNKWVHVREPWDGQELQIAPEKIERELQEMAKSAIKTLREVLYENQWL
jgi:hypothetical protein